MPRHSLKPWFDLPDVLDGMQLHSVSIGYDEKVYILASTTHILSHDGTFPFVHTKRPVDYVAFVINDHKQISSYPISSQTLIYSYLQPLPDGELLLAGARSRFRSESDYELNGQVFSRDGILQREFLLGDGISHLQTTGQGMIWAED